MIDPKDEELRSYRRILMMKVFPSNTSLRTDSIDVFQNQFCYGILILVLP